MGNPLPGLRDVPRPPTPTSVVEWSPSESLSNGYLRVEGSRHTNAVAFLWTARSQYARDYADAVQEFPVGNAARSLRGLGRNIEVFFDSQALTETTRHVASLATIELLRPEQYVPDESLFVRTCESENRRHSDVLSALTNAMLQLRLDYRETVSVVQTGIPTASLLVLHADFSMLNCSLTRLELDHHNAVVAITTLLATTGMPVDNEVSVDNEDNGY
jgi:hypothetical protein